MEITSSEAEIILETTAGLSGEGLDVGDDARELCRKIINTYPKLITQIGDLFILELYSSD